MVAWAVLADRFGIGGQVGFGGKQMLLLALGVGFLFAVLPGSFPRQDWMLRRSAAAWAPLVLVPVAALQLGAMLASARRDLVFVVEHRE